MSRRWRFSCAAFGVLLAWPLGAAAQPAAAPPASGLHWRQRPSIQAGPYVRLDLRLKLSHDWRRMDADADVDVDRTFWRLRRAGVNGQIGRRVSFIVERDLNSDGRWRDVYLTWRGADALEITAGRFKVPLGREMIASSTTLEFAYRTLATTAITHSRDIGLKLHGRTRWRGLTYDAGVFRRDGDTTRASAMPAEAGGRIEPLGPVMVLRTTATPLQRTLPGLRVGAAASTLQVPRGPYSLRGRTVYGGIDFFAPVDVNGRRTRLGADVAYTAGPAGLMAEWLRSREQRRGVGAGGADLPPLTATGWYVAGSWLLTGEDKGRFEAPARPLPGDGIGAVEATARYERLRFEDGVSGRGSRANGEGVWTMGVNWWPNRWVRVTVNGVREAFDDPLRTPRPGATVFWSSVTRLQLVF